MNQTATNNIADLGRDYQLDLFHELIFDVKFGEAVINVLEINHFNSEAEQKLLSIIKKYYTQHETIPTFPNLRTQINIDVPITEVALKQQLLDELQIIEDRVIPNKNVQDYAIKFCKMQSLKIVWNDIHKKIERGVVEEYDDIEKKLKDALIYKEVEDAIELFHDVDGVLSDDYRDPIATDINGIDELIGGGLSKGELALVIAPLGVGKAQPLTSKILTPYGWITMKDVNIGTKVISSDSNVINVTGIFPQDGLRDVYTIIFNDNSKAECDINHIWSVNTLDMRHNNDNLFKSMELSEIINDGLYKENELNFRIPVIKCVDFNDKSLNVDPYIMGCIIGSDEITSIIVNLFLNNLNGDTIIKNLNYYYPNRFNNENVYIHSDYIYNSKKNRIDLLHGLLDTKGYISNGNACLKSKSKQLIEDIKEIVLSLGGTVEIKNNKDISFVITIFFEVNTIEPFLSIEKNKEIIYKKLPKHKYISEIIYKGKEETKCILVDSEKHEYITDEYTVTHNTTFLTKVANAAYLNGKNVLQIFFEDKEKDIQRKHYTAMTHIPLNEIASDEGRELARNRLRKIKENRTDDGKEKNHLFLQKLPADGVTVTKIKNIIKKLNSKGYKIDLLVLDYIDCLSLEKETYRDEEWSNEGKIMRLLETMISEMDVACWTATQGNRSSTGAEVVKSENMGGSIKKAQIAHIVIGIAKTLEQKTKNLATISFLKNRLGPDGMIFENCKFNNGKLEIDANDCISELGFEQNKEVKQKEKLKQRWEEKEAKKAIEQPQNN